MDHAAVRQTQVPGAKQQDYPASMTFLLPQASSGTISCEG
jgi:hypothetical protein